MALLFVIIINQSTPVCRQTANAADKLSGIGHATFDLASSDTSNV